MAKKLFTQWLIIISSSLLFTAILPVFGKKESEAWFQQVWCESLEGKMEVMLDDFTRVDCLTPEYAIEMDFAHKWHEAIGQALHYARKTHKKPGIVLVLKSKSENQYVTQLKATLKHFELPVKVWQLGPWEEQIY